MSKKVDKINWYRTHVPADKMQELLQASDLKGFKQAGGHVLLVAGIGALIYAIYHSSLSWLWLVPLLFLYNNCLSMLAAGVHELVHERVFKTNLWNRFFLNLISFFTWWNHPFFHFSHKEHHRYTGNDPLDEEVILPGSLDKLALLKAMLFPPSGMVANLKKHWNLANGRHPGFFAGGAEWTEHVMSRMSKKECRGAVWFSRLLLLGHGAILVYSVVTQNWILPLLTTLPTFYFTLFNPITHMPQHLGLPRGVSDFRINCRTYTSNRFFMFLYWNMNYHIEHHMYASVPCYNLPKLHQAIKHDLPFVHNSLWDVWVEMLYIVKRQKEDPSWEYLQPFPVDSPNYNKVNMDTVGKILKTHDAPTNASVFDEPVYTEEELKQYKIWECTVCAFIYDEAYGLPEEGIAPGTRWEDIPEDWSCPDCGIAKSDFIMQERSRFRDDREPKPDEASHAQHDAEPLVIVGSGMAGYSLAGEYRKHNAFAPVILITRDSGDNYSKPMLSNAIAKKQLPQDLVKMNAQQMAEELGIEVWNHTEVTAIEIGDKVLRAKSSTEDKEVKYANLVLATGADQIKLPINGSGASEILRVNDLADYEQFRKQLVGKSRIVVLGAGLIGCEFANDLLHEGHKLDLVDLAAWPLSALVPEQAGKYLQNKLEDKGVKFHLQASIESVEKVGDTYCCELSDGTTIEADLVLSAIGLRPRTGLASSAKLEVNRGIVTDAYLQTSSPNVYALGDCAETEGQVRPYILPIRHGVKALASTLSGQQEQVVYPEMPVIVKTPACPVSCVPLARDSQEDGQWSVSEGDAYLSCQFITAAGKCIAHAYLGDVKAAASAVLESSQ